jgi:hypothetical protein
MVIDHQGRSHGSASFTDVVREGALFGFSPRMGLLDLVMTLSGTLPPFKKREAQYVYDITVVRQNDNSEPHLAEAACPRCCELTEIEKSTDNSNFNKTSVKAPNTFGLKPGK